MAELRLTLGCGAKVLADAINHDRYPRAGVDLAFDMTVFPWPVDHLRGRLKHIIAEDVLEHIPPEKLIAVFDECWGLLADGGTMFVQVPVHGSYYHLADLTHCRGFCADSFDVLDPATTIGGKTPWYTTRHWRIDRKESDNKPLDRGANLRFWLSKRS